MRILSYLQVQDMREVDGTQHYRQVSPLRTLHKQVEDIEVTCMIQKTIDDIVESYPTEEEGLMAASRPMLGYDIYAYPRVIHEDAGEFLRAIHERGGLLVIDADDDLTEDYKLVSGRGHLYKEALGLVDYVTVSTQALADHLNQYTKNPCTVLLNCVEVDWMQQLISRSQRIVEGWTMGFSGSPTHWGDWRLPAVPFQRICREYDVTAILHGEVPRYLKSSSGDALLIKGVPYCIYPGILKQFDILLCAVDSKDKFNSGKSAVKALEAMAIGVVPICSRFKPYMDLAANGAPLVIIEEESQDGWYEAMAKLLDDPMRIEHLQNLGAEWVRANRDMSNGYKQWEKFFRSITVKKSIQ